MVHGAILYTILALWPEFRGQWHPAGLAGTLVLGMSVSELVWAAMTGLGWVVSIGTVLNLQPPAKERDPVGEALTQK